jgi:glycosyltransferase involved in cell wall biosynthesis
MKVSIIIPCYNVQDFIASCIKSIENQTYSNLEVICINDGSTDQTSAVLKDLCSKSNLSIQVIEQDNLGAPSARNTGLNSSTGAYVQFLDADDLLLPTKIEKQIQLAKQTNLPDLIVGSFTRENLAGKQIDQRIYTPKDGENIWLNLMKTDLGNTCANLFKAQLFQKGLRWKENLASSQEYTLMIEILQNDPRVIFDAAVATRIRIRESGSISLKNIDLKWERYVQLRVDILNFLKEKKPELVSSEVYQILFRSIRMLYPHNPEKAIAFFDQNMPSTFQPKVSPSTGKSYVHLYKIFGFQKTEQIRRLITKRKAK